MATSSVAARLISALPTELPLLLIGGGLANLTLARALTEVGQGSASHLRLFEQFPATSHPHYSLNIHQYASAPLQNALKSPGLIDDATVDYPLGGRGRIETDLYDLETGAVLGPLDLPKGRTAHVNRARLASVIAGNKLSIEHGKKFDRWELVRDSGGREAVCAVFADGSEAIGCAIIGGDGVHSAVRTQLHPTCQPKVLPVVAYTGRWKNEARIALQLDPKVNKTPYAHRNDADVYRIDAADQALFCQTFSRADASEVAYQWMYYRSPRPDGEADPLWRPKRALGEADTVPDEIYDELGALGEKTAKDMQVLVSSLKKGETTGVRNWLMRTVSLPTEPSAVPGADRVIVIGDAAHGAPILAGESASHSVLDGVLLARSLSKAFDGLAETSDRSYPISHPRASTQGPVLQAIRAWEAGQRERWQASVDDAETRCIGMLKPIEVWRQAAPGAAAHADP